MDERDCVLVENSDIGKLEEIRADMNNFVGTMEAPADDLPPEDQEQHIANTVKQVHDFLTQKNASYPILLSASCLNAHSEYMKTKILPSLILAGAEKHFHGGDSGRSDNGTSSTVLVVVAVNDHSRGCTCRKSACSGGTSESTVAHSRHSSSGWERSDDLRGERCT